MSEKLAIFLKNSNAARIDARALNKPENPYRQILRRHVPEPFLALLMFMMGVWLWDNHFAPQAGYEEDACRMALIKIDRDLRLAEAAEKFPSWLRTAAGIDARQATLDTAVKSLATLGTEGALSVEGAYALTILNAIRKGEDPVSGPFVDPRLTGPPDPKIIMERVDWARDSWWDRQYLVAFGNRGATQIGLKSKPAEEDSRNRELALRVIVSRGMVWLFAVAGLFFVPRTLAAFRRGAVSRPSGYVGHWPVGLGLAVFFLAYLASVGFQMTLNAALRGGAGGEAIYLSPPVLAVLDAVTRLLPALVALGFLFREGWTCHGSAGGSSRSRTSF